MKFALVGVIEAGWEDHPWGSWAAVWGLKLFLLATVLAKAEQPAKRAAVWGVKLFQESTIAFWNG
jgi:hypothetical protein